MVGPRDENLWTSFANCGPISHTLVLLVLALMIH
jgi:hypothetical protein